MPVRLRIHGLQQAAIVEVDQVALPARATGDEQCYRQLRMLDDIVAAHADLGGEYLCTVEAVAHRIVPAVRVVTGGQQQGLLALARQRPAAEGEGAEQQAAQAQYVTSQHSVSHRRSR
ncbi:hypothetical protein D3C81_915410 [compost metagenome]